MIQSVNDQQMSWTLTGISWQLLANGCLRLYGVFYRWSQLVEHWGRTQAVQYDTKNVIWKHFVCCATKHNLPAENWKGPSFTPEQLKALWNVRFRLAISHCLFPVYTWVLKTHQSFAFSKPKADWSAGKRTAKSDAETDRR